MAREIVEVTGVIGNQVCISFHKGSMCKCCHIGPFCRRGHEDLRIDRSGHALGKGDTIEIEISSKKTLLAGILVFLIPATVFVASLAWFQDKEALESFFLAIAAVSVYYVILKLFLNRYKRSFEIRIVRRLTRQNNNSTAE